MIKNILYLLTFIGVLFEMLFHSSVIINSVSFAFQLCINNLFPSLFPFMILSNILLEYGFVEITSELFKPIMKIFKAHENGSFVLILSMLSGSPSNAKYISDLLNKELISSNDAQKLLLFTHFVNPLFIINTIGISFLHNQKVGIIILISHYLGNIIVGLLSRKYHPNNRYKKIDLKKAFSSLEKEHKSFIFILTNAIISSINTLLIILGVITTCLIMTSLININPLYNGFLEITQGLKYLSTTNHHLLFKALLATFLISFGGFSIHAQVFSILNNKKIKYIPYLCARFIHGIISSTLVYILFKIIYI